VVAVRLSFERCALTVELSHGLVLALPGPGELDPPWRFRLCRRDGDRLQTVDDHVHLATVLLLAGDRRELVGMVESVLSFAAPDLDDHPDPRDLPAELAPLLRELAESRRVFEVSENVFVEWDGSTVLFEVGLEQVLEQGDSGDAVIFDAEDRYVQVLVNRERRIVYGEAVEPEHWEAGQPLTGVQRQRLAGLGWSEPGLAFESPNHARLWTLGARCTVEDVARALTDTMSTVYGLTPGEQLTMTILHHAGRGASPELGFLDAVEIDARYRESMRNGASLEGAVLRPERRHRYEDVTDVTELAAALLVAVNRRHALAVGNERASVSLADELLTRNGYRLDGDDGVLAELVREVAAGLGEQETAGRLRPLVAAGAPALPFAERRPRVIEALAG